MDTVNWAVYQDEHEVRFFLLLNREISGKKASEFAMEVVKTFAYLISEQNGDYAPPSEDSFGGYLDDYSIYVMVGPDDTKADTSTWILEDTIPAGEYREFVARDAAEGSSAAAESSSAAEESSAAAESDGAAESGSAAAEKQ